MSVRGAGQQINAAVSAWEGIVAAGQAVPHHVLPESGWISFYIRDPGDVEKGIALLRRSYEIAVDQRARTMARRGQRPE